MKREVREGGGFAFIPAIRAFSMGVVADRAHEIRRVDAGVPLEELPRFVEEVVSGRWDRPPESVCAMELRSPRPRTWEEFGELNERYAAMLDDLGVTVGGVNPVARTNVVPLVGPPDRTMVHALCLTVPSDSPRACWVVAGAAEVPDASTTEIVREGEGSLDAVHEKADFVLGRLAERLRWLGAEPDVRQSAHVYTACALDAELYTEIGKRVGDSDGSFRMHPSRPPIDGLDFEMDLRSVTA